MESAAVRAGQLAEPLTLLERGSELAAMLDHLLDQRSNSLQERIRLGNREVLLRHESMIRTA